MNPDATYLREIAPKCSALAAIDPQRLREIADRIEEYESLTRDILYAMHKSGEFSMPFLIRCERLLDPEQFRLPQEHPNAH